nr:MAG TPA: hypothetical protein [Caudoviricetes sp.]
MALLFFCQVILRSRIMEETRLYHGLMNTRANMAQ